MHLCLSTTLLWSSRHASLLELTTDGGVVDTEALSYLSQRQTSRVELGCLGYIRVGQSTLDDPGAHTSALEMTRDRRLVNTKVLNKLVNCLSLLVQGNQLINLSPIQSYMFLT